MAPNFLSKFVKANDGHPRSRTISDVGDIRARRSVSSAFESKVNSPPSVVLTTDNSNSPVAPSTPGSLHRQDSPRKSRSTMNTPSTQSKELKEVVDMPQTMSPENVPVSPEMGLGIDLGQLPKLPEPVLSQPPGFPKESNGNLNGVNHQAKRKVSSKSLKSLKNQRNPNGTTGIPPTLSTPSVESVPGSQEMEVPVKTTGLVESPTSDITPTTTSFSAPEADAIPPSTSTTSQTSLQTRSRDADTMSVSSGVSSNKKMPWRRGSSNSNKKRKPTGLASAIAASGLAMANPAITQSLSQFAPPPNSPPRGKPGSPRGSVSGSRKRGTSNASHARTRSLTAAEGNDHFYSDLESGSEDGLDLDEEIPVTGFAVASNKRNADFHDMFPQVPEGDYLIEGIVFMVLIHLTTLLMTTTIRRLWMRPPT